MSTYPIRKRDIVADLERLLYLEPLSVFAHSDNNEIEQMQKETKRRASDNKRVILLVTFYFELLT